MYMYPVSDHVNSYNQHNSLLFDAFDELINIYGFFFRCHMYYLRNSWEGAETTKPLIKKHTKKDSLLFKVYQAGIFYANSL